MECKDKLNILVDSSLLEECVVSRIWTAQFCSSARLDETVRDHFASFPSLVKDTVVRLPSNEGRVTELDAITKVMAVIGTVNNRPFAKFFQSSALLIAV